MFIESGDNINETSIGKPMSYHLGNIVRELTLAIQILAKAVII